MAIKNIIDNYRQVLESLTDFIEGNISGEPKAKVSGILKTLKKGDTLSTSSSLTVCEIFSTLETGAA